MTNIFGPTGAINTDLDTSEIPETRRAQYLALVAAQRACEQAEANEKAANDTVAEAVVVHDRALAALPQQSRIELVRESAAAWAREHGR